jgi:hypothetical protein
MLTDKDIDKLMKVFATKADLDRALEEKLDEKMAPLTELVHQTLNAVEGIASRLDREDLTNAARDAQLTRHDAWVRKIAQNTNVSLKD